MNRPPTWLNALLASILPTVLMAVVPAQAQQPGAEENLPELNIEEVTVVGTRIITLPSARKGEVLDTTVYLLPPGDTLMFGDRISNLSGSGGALPEYGEFRSPLDLLLEASIGTYISPRAMAYARYRIDDVTLAGTFDYRSTAGHTDGAEASSFFLGGHAGMAISGDNPLPGNAEAVLDVELGNDGYTLYGNSIAPLDRERNSVMVRAGLHNAGDRPFEYALDVEVANTGVADDTGTADTSISALTPSFDFAMTYGTDELRGGARLGYSTTSLDYSGSTNTPAFFSLGGEVEWSPSAGVFLTLGGFYATGGFSDSGSTSMVMPVASIRYQVSPTIFLFGGFAPELRPASYRDRMMRAPYVDREITLRPERVPINLTGGMRLSTEPMTIEGRLFFEQAENTPVVVSGDSAGVLFYDHVDSRTIGAVGSAQITIGDNITAGGEASVRSAIERGTDRELPMVPLLELRGRGEFKLSETLMVFGTLGLSSERTIALDDENIPEDERTIPGIVLLGGGVVYDVLSNLEVFGEVTNLLNYNYDLWHNYSAPGLEVRGGLRARF